MAAHSREFWATAKVLDRILKTKLCLAEAENSPCDSAIVKAHTIPRSQLRQIAVDGHVNQVSFSMAQLAQNNGELVASKVGINQFSVLNCFCAKHDKALFTELEDKPLIPIPTDQNPCAHWRNPMVMIRHG